MELSDSARCKRCRLDHKHCSLADAPSLPSSALRTRRTVPLNDTPAATSLKRSAPEAIASSSKRPRTNTPSTTSSRSVSSLASDLAQTTLRRSRSETILAATTDAVSHLESEIRFLSAEEARLRSLIAEEDEE